MSRKLYRNQAGEVRISDSSYDATHYSELPPTDDPRWVKGCPSILDTTVLTLSPSYPSGRLAAALERKKSNPIMRHPNHPPFEGVAAWMHLDQIQWSELEYKFSLPGVWEDLGDRCFAKFYGTDRTRWLEAKVYDGEVILQAKVSGNFSEVMLATTSVGEFRLPVRIATEEIHEAVTKLENRLNDFHPQPRIEWKPSIEQRNDDEFEFLYVDGLYVGIICCVDRSGVKRWRANSEKEFCSKDEAKSFSETQYLEKIGAL